MIVAAISILLTQNSNLSNQQLSFRQILYVYYTLYRKNRIIYLTWAYHPQIIVEQGLSPGSSDYESDKLLLHPTITIKKAPRSNSIYESTTWRNATIQKIHHYIVMALRISKRLFGRRPFLLHLSGFPCHTIGVWIGRILPPQITSLIFYKNYIIFIPFCKELSYFLIIYSTLSHQFS